MKWLAHALLAAAVGCVSSGQTMPAADVTVGFGIPVGHGEAWHGRVLAAGHDGVWWVGSYATVYEIVDDQIARSIEAPSDVLALRIAGRRVLAAPHLIELDDGAVVPQPPLWNKASMHVIPEQTVAQLAAWSPDGARLAVLAETRPGRGKHRDRRPSGPQLQLWLMDGVERLDRRMIWSGGAGKYSALRFEASMLVLAGSELRVFDDDGRLVHELTPPADIADGCFSHDERWFVAALENGQLGRWDTLAWTHTLTSQARDVPWLSVAAHPHHAIVVAGADDGTLAAFDLRTAQQLAVTRLDPASAIHAVAISEDGTSILISTSIQMWTLALHIDG